MERTIRHGSVAGYNARCRCEQCRAAWARYHRDRKHRLGEQRPRVEADVARELARAEARLPAVVAADADTPLTVQLSPLAYQILVEIQRRRRQRRGEIVDELLRRYGPDLAGADDAAA